MFNKSAVAYTILLDEMKRMRDVMSTQETRPYIPSHFSRLTPQCLRIFFSPFCRCVVVTLSQAKVTLPPTVASSHYLVTMQKYHHCCLLFRCH